MSGANLSREKREQYMRVFNELDTDGNGWLSREEIGQWLKRAGYSLSETQIESVFRMIDKNSDGKITLDEFYTFMELINKPPDSTSKLRQVFTSMDTNGDGQLSEDELVGGLNRCGYQLTRQQVHKLIANLDTDGDGTISFEEFLAAFQ
ncbi:calmodulin-like protein 5 [Littorina saxatilis]|uniref:EF-hand domain-containing protein n=1 Tax=Littorina saxatilis TaxID=31220 RepID=A0AAN9BRI4_9CAEN